MPHQLFAQRTIGGMHINAGLPCQDYSLCETGHDRQWLIFSVADGHGSRRHFRSDKGSEIACKEATKIIRDYLLTKDNTGLPDPEDIINLKNEILNGWRAGVREDAENHPWTPDELKEQETLLSIEKYEALLNGESTLIPYGSTLLIGWKTSEYWCVMQLGDGGFAKVLQDGQYFWPMPKSKINEGSLTASLCMKDPLPEFRHCMGTDNPLALLIYSDGIEKAFPEQSEELSNFLYRVLKIVCSGMAGYEEGIQYGIRRLAQNGRVRDDVSIAGIVDTDQENHDPVRTVEQTDLLQQKLDMALSECEAAIQYNLDRLNHLAMKDGEEHDRIVQIAEIIATKCKQKQQIIDEMKQLQGEVSTEETDHESIGETEKNDSPISDFDETSIDEPASDKVNMSGQTESTDVSDESPIPETKEETEEMNLLSELEEDSIEAEEQQTTDETEPGLFDGDELSERRDKSIGRIKLLFNRK